MGGGHEDAGQDVRLEPVSCRRDGPPYAGGGPQRADGHRQRMEEDIPGGERRDRISGAALPGGIPAPERRRWPPGRADRGHAEHYGTDTEPPQNHSCRFWHFPDHRRRPVPALLFLSGAGGTTDGRGEPGAPGQRGKIPQHPRQHRGFLP